MSLCYEPHGFTRHALGEETLLCTRPEGHDGRHMDGNNPPAIPLDDTTQPWPLVRAWPIGVDPFA